MAILDLRRTFATAIAFTVMLTITCIPAVSHAEDDADGAEDLYWITGPHTGDLGEHAQIGIPEGYIFTDGDGTRALLESMQEIPNGREVGFVAKEEDDWFVIFEFDDIGFVKDDEKDSLDADAIFDSIKEGNDRANEVRAENGWSTVQLTGWHTKPVYNEQTHNLEWAIQGESEGYPVVNYNTRILGRKGVMNVTLVVDPVKLDELMPTYRDLLTDFSYKPGHKYAEYVEGDKLAKFGLAALVAGGATAVAAKSGLLKGLWKIIVIAAAAVGAFFKRIFGKKKVQQ